MFKLLRVKNVYFVQLRILMMFGQATSKTLCKFSLHTLTNLKQEFRLSHWGDRQLLVESHVRVPHKSLIRRQGIKPRNKLFYLCEKKLSHIAKRPVIVSTTLPADTSAKGSFVTCVIWLETSHDCLKSKKITTKVAKRFVFSNSKFSIFAEDASCAQIHRRCPE